jgi:hypothetical protein
VFFEGAIEKGLEISKVEEAEDDSEALDVAAVLRLEALSLKVRFIVSTFVELMVVTEDSKVVGFSEKNDVVVASSLCGSAEKVVVSKGFELSSLFCNRCSCSLASSWSHR